jgi:hypothetical protein
MCEDNIKVDLTNGIWNFGLDAYGLGWIWFAVVNHEVPVKFWEFSDQLTES